MCSWGLLFPQLCLISKKTEVGIQRYSYKLNFVILNCVLSKFWRIWNKTPFCVFSFPSWLLLRGSKRRAASLTWNQNTALLFKAFCSEKQWKLQGSKGWEKGAAEMVLDLWQTLLWKWDNLELQGWTRNRRQEWNWDGKNTPGEWNTLKITGEGGGTVINGEWQKKW